MNVVVTGPESSGTRFVARWLEAHPEVTARHWSMPSGEGWMRHWPTDHDFEAERPAAVVWVVRNFTATVKSQLARGMVGSADEARAAITQAHLRVLTWTVSHGLDLIPVLYDDIVAHPDRMGHTFDLLGLEPVDCPTPIIDGSAPHVDGVPPASVTSTVRFVPGQDIPGSWREPQRKPVCVRCGRVMDDLEAAIGDAPYCHPAGAPSCYEQAAAEAVGEMIDRLGALDLGPEPQAAEPLAEPPEQ